MASASVVCGVEAELDSFEAGVPCRPICDRKTRRKWRVGGPGWGRVKAAAAPIKGSPVHHPSSPLHTIDPEKQEATYCLDESVNRPVQGSVHGPFIGSAIRRSAALSRSSRLLGLTAAPALSIAAYLAATVQHNILAPSDCVSIHTEPLGDLAIAAWPRPTCSIASNSTTPAMQVRRHESLDWA
jgi:hypothetical protein